MPRRLILALLAAAASLPARGADDDIRAMRAQLEALKQQVQQLEQRLDKSEKQKKVAASKDADDSSSTLSISTGAGHPRNQQLDRKAVKQIAGDTYQNEQSKKVKVGGALRYNYTVSDFKDSQSSADRRERGGDINLDTFRIDLDADIDNVLFSAEYRFYDYMRTIHHGWVGYRFGDDSKVEVGVTKVPFGILPFASHNFFFSTNYYLGLEDDYDSGVKYSGSRGNFDYAFAFFKNDEKNGFDAQRYSFDPTNLPTAPGNRSDDPNTAVDELGDRIQETNTGNIRLAYTLQHAQDYSTEFGISGQYGQIYNNTRHTNYGHNEAYALHAVGNYDRWNVMFQVARYEYSLDGGETAIGAAAYASNYPFASEGDSYVANLSYTLPLACGPFDSIEFYNDYSYVGNKSGGFDNTWQNVLGAAVTAGNIFTYFDLVAAKNEPFIGGIETGNDSETDTRFNINLGYYF